MPDVGNFGTLVSLIVLGVTYIIIQPLKQSIASLIKSTEKLASVMECTQADVNELRERVAKVESSLGSAHKRIDSIDSKIRG